MDQREENERCMGRALIYVEDWAPKLGRHAIYMIHIENRIHHVILIIT